MGDVHGHRIAGQGQLGFKVVAGAVLGCPPVEVAEEVEVRAIKADGAADLAVLVTMLHNAAAISDGDEVGNGFDGHRRPIRERWLREFFKLPMVLL